MASTASAVTVLSSDFDGRTVSGATASDISWTTNGVDNPGDLTVVGENFVGGSFAATFFDTTGAADRLGVDLNTENEGLWFIEISLDTLANTIALDTLNLDAFSFNNSGALQTVDREVDITVSIERDSDGFVLFSDEADNVQFGAIPAGGPFGVSFDLSGVSLADSTAYTLVLGANSDTRNRGNNAGIDNFELLGTVAPVPVPAGLPLILTGLAAFAFIRRRA